uniref:Uncharacterized protein n=1 Tax=Triticum aestivum TaxID=4565 RepID=A0A3B6LFM6_WHEAT
MAKRRRQESSEKRCDCDCGKRRRKHLYLVLDDWDKGFSVHRLDALSFLFRDDSDGSDDNGGETLRRLPDPPAVRITEARHSLCSLPAWAPPSSSPTRNNFPLKPPAPSSTTRRVETAAMAMGPGLPENPCCVFVAAGRGESKDDKGRKHNENEKLYTLAKVDHGGRSNHPSGHLMGVSVHALSWARNPAAVAEPWLPSHEWAWESVAAPMAPFDGNEETVVSYAVHPDGRTIFFSTRGRGWRPAGTYSFDTQQGEWRSHGEWVLPFDGQGYFERELDAWVGLHKDGYICCCQAATATPEAGAAPEWRKTERKLFREGDRERHLGATLTYMGNNVFCLVESVVQEGVEPGRAYGAGRGCALHVTVFGLRYSRDGELQATVRRVTKSYAVCKYIPGFTHEAFWM